MTAAEFCVKPVTAFENKAIRPHLVGKSQQVPRSDRPKLDVGPFVKSDDHTAAGRDRELRALTRR